LSSASSASEAAAAVTAPPSAKPQPKTFAHAIARASLASSQVIKTTDAATIGSSKDDDALATALEKYAIAQEKVGEARLAQDAAIQARFLQGWSTTLNTQIQFATKARKGVEGARLNLDATKAKLRGSAGFNFSGQHRDHIADDENLSEEARAEIEAKEDDFVAQTEEAAGVMKNVSFVGVRLSKEVLLLSNKYRSLIHQNHCGIWLSSLLLRWNSTRKLTKYCRSSHLLLSSSKLNKKQTIGRFAMVDREVPFHCCQLVNETRGN
jgi:Bin/amphiphysin/Rvs domain for vesicular trafficking